MSCSSIYEHNFQPIAGRVNFEENIASVKWRCNLCGESFTEAYQQYTDHLEVSK